MEGLGDCWFLMSWFGLVFFPISVLHSLRFDTTGLPMLKAVKKINMGHTLVNVSCACDIMED